MFCGLGGSCLDGGGSGSTSLGLYGPQAFSVGGGPSTVNARLAWNCGSQSCQQSGGPGQPALHAPGLPANNYSGNQASGLRELVFGKGIDA